MRTTAPAGTARVLVVDDDARVRTVVAWQLEADGFAVLEAADGQAALDVIAQQRPDLVVLDLSLPGVGGLDVLRRVRAGSPAGAGLPVIVLSGRSGETDRIVGLDLGADDYLVKPFSPGELAARVRSVLRRTQPAAGADPPAGLRVDTEAREVTVDGRRVELTAREFDLLAACVALLRRQTEVLELIAAGAALREVLTGIAVALEDLVPGCRCSILLLAPGGSTLHHAAAPSLPEEYSAQIDGMSIGREAGSCGTAAHLGVPVIAEDARTDPRWPRFRALADRYALRSCWSTPIRGRAGVIGTFAVYHGWTHRPSDREQRLVERLTHLASMAIDHDGLFGALTESEERFRRAFEDNAVGMALAELDGAVSRVNGAMRELLGRGEEMLLGVHLHELFRPRQPVPEYPAQYEATALTADGRRLELAVAVSPVRGADGLPVHLCVNVLDVTQRRAAERERHRRREAEVARGAAEAASRAKSDFVAALGHELRTPLQAITGFTELLRTLDLPAERRAAALEHIESASGHILSLVDDVLDVARIEAGGLPVQLGAVDLDTVVADVLALLEPLAAAERATLRGPGFHPARPGTWVCADPRRFRQVLINLVTNAIRYNRPDGSVLVGVTPADTEVVITVRDTGPGIAPENLARLFTPFDRLGTTDGQGVGLGLPLARGLTLAMGGRLAVRSTVGTGTEVELALPVASRPRSS